MPELARQSGELDISIEDGVDFNMDVFFKVGGVAVNISSYTASFVLKDSHSSSEVLLQLTVGSGITLDAPTGKFTISLTEAQSNFGNRTMVYDFEVTSPLGDSAKLLRGTCKSWA